MSNDYYLHPGDFPPGSIESRAAAREVLEQGKCSVTITELLEPDGRLCDSRIALVNGEIVERKAVESLEEFKERCCHSGPAMMTRVIVEMQGDSQAADPRAERTLRISSPLDRDPLRWTGEESEAARSANRRVFLAMLRGFYGLSRTVLNFPKDRMEELCRQVAVIYDIHERS